jgi:hypothetical protein
MCLVRIPAADGTWASEHYVGGTAIFRFTPMTETLVRQAVADKAKRDAEDKARREQWEKDYATRRTLPASTDDAPIDATEEF